MKCMVTGGNGFIGSHVVQALQEAEHQVTVLDQQNTLEATEFVQADIRDVDALTAAFKRQKTEVVFHIAAMANARQALDDPIGAVDLNIKGTVCALEAARRAEVGRVVLASTVWYYNAADRTSKGNGAKGPLVLDETTPVLPTGGGHIYTTSKIASELLCQDFAQLYGQSFTVLRYGIPYGPRMWRGLALREFLENTYSSKPIRIFGDGSAVRRFLFVEDIASAHVLALSPKAENQVYNLEGPEDITIKRLAEAVAQYVPGTTIEYVEEPSRRGELQGQGIVISNEKAKRDLGWSPSVPLEEGVRRTVEWFKKAQGI